MTGNTYRFITFLATIRDLPVWCLLNVIGKEFLYHKAALDFDPPHRGFTQIKKKSINHDSE